MEYDNFFEKAVSKIKVVVIEGSRGTGKSTLAFQLRQSLKNSTLINLTGFNIDGEEGLKKITAYYHNWLLLLHNMSMENIEQTIICDRIFFTEKVFSKLYKNYDFSEAYDNFVELFSLLNPTIIYLTIHDEKELSLRLDRDKVPFHDIKDSVKETLKQQEEYEKIFKNVENKFNIIHIDTTYLTADKVKNLVLSKI